MTFGKGRKDDRLRVLLLEVLLEIMLGKPRANDIFFVTFFGE